MQYGAADQVKRFWKWSYVKNDGDSFGHIRIDLVLQLLLLLELNTPELKLDTGVLNFSHLLKTSRYLHKDLHFWRTLR